MCVAALAWNAHPEWLLVVIGNRDEAHVRPTAPLARWSDGSGVIAGRDLQGGGTWLGISERGRFALLTNFRTQTSSFPGRLSRGALVTDMLAARQLQGLADMNPFNAIYGDGAKLIFLTNHPQPSSAELSPGIHGLSNGGFDQPWGKTAEVTHALDRWLHSGDRDLDPLLAALVSEHPHPPLGEAGDPSTAPVFIRDPLYGTRCSTVLAIPRSGAGTIIERSFDPSGRATSDTRLVFNWPAVPPVEG